MQFRSFKEGTDKDKTVTNLAELPRIRQSEQGIGACLEPEGNAGVGRNAGQVRGKADDGVGTTYASSTTRMPQVLEPPSFSGSPRHGGGGVGDCGETMYRNQFREARRDSPGENAGASFTSLGLKVIPEEVDASKKCHNLATLHGLQSS